jgi:hypothetical protein
MPVLDPRQHRDVGEPEAQAGGAVDGVQPQEPTLHRHVPRARGGVRGL